MKGFLQANCWGFVALLIVLCNLAIVNRHFRDVMINDNLNSSMDYAMDCLSDYYRQHGMDDSITSSDYIDACMHAFNDALKETINSEGELTVSLLVADIDAGIFDIVVTEKYDYHILNASNKTTCERAIAFGQ